jgi:uncharacterized Ntn-hydrolase superfamily protein
MTYSILARDPATGTLGAAVASRFFAVGGLCIHVEGGVAALATQALVNPMYAVHAMPRLRAGEGAEAVLRSLVAPDPIAGQRQFHILDAAGAIAQHTGRDCVTWAGHVHHSSAGQDVSVAGNMLAAQQVVQATLEGYLRATGSMAERLLSAMEAGEAAGGDKRGRQSAGLKICTADPYPDLDIRSDDHPDPLADLRRLHRISLERYAIFRRFLAGRDSPWGESDRTVIEAAIARDGKPPA